jgi:uncharacterized membrane protein
MSVKRQNDQRMGVRLNRWVLSFSRHWLRVALTVLGIYVTLPFVAPTLMKLGLEEHGRALYFLYGPFCHQFAFRSVFLYGEQPFYPRYNTGSPYIPFETYAQNLPEFTPDRQINIMGNVQAIGDIYAFSPAYQLASRDFVGNEQMGYKVTICERDISIYLAMFIGGIGYGFVRKKLRPCPFWLYVILGIAPIGIDGFSQLFGYPPFNLWASRETLPLFRIVTGALFGLMNVWLGFPYFEESMKETQRELEEKFRRLGILTGD